MKIIFLNPKKMEKGKREIKTNLNANIAIVTINTNGLNNSLKRQKLLD